MDVVRQFTNRCACGWEYRGPRDEVVDATIDHGQRIHNMAATRSDVLAALRDDDTAGPPDDGAGATVPGTRAE